MSQEALMDIQSVMRYLPHRYPFLLVDRVLELTPGERIVALKNVSVNEHFFSGHFPQRAVMPGVLILEALAQAAAILAYKSTNWSPETSIFYLGSIENARFKKVVTPGDQLALNIEVLKRRSAVWKFGATATVGGEVVCTAEMTSAERKVNLDS